MLVPFSTITRRCTADVIGGQEPEHTYTPERNKRVLVCTFNVMFIFFGPIRSRCMLHHARNAMHAIQSQQFEHVEHDKTQALATSAMRCLCTARSRPCQNKQTGCETGHPYQLHGDGFLKQGADLVLISRQDVFLKIFCMT